jgi:hypothetical protein
VDKSHNNVNRNFSSKQSRLRQDSSQPPGGSSLEEFASPFQASEDEQMKFFCVLKTIRGLYLLHPSEAQSTPRYIVGGQSRERSFKKLLSTSDDDLRE